MKIHRVKLTKAKLAAMSQRERTLLILLGHANNEINVFSKLLLMTPKRDPSVDLINHVEAGQIFIIMRVLIGKLHEAWELFRKRVQDDRPLAELYIPRLAPEAKTALEELNRHFGQSSPLTNIRNNIAFHYKDNENLVEANFPRISESEPWEFYLARTVGNSFYYASELVVSLSAINLVKREAESASAPSSIEAFAQLCDIVIMVSGQITELFGHLMAEIVTSCIPSPEMVTEQLPDGPKLSSFSLPYFFDENDSWDRSEAAPIRTLPPELPPNFPVTGWVIGSTSARDYGDC